MFATKLTDTAELRPLEPWQAAEFLAHIDQARTTLEQYLPWVERIVDEQTAAAFLQRYADRQAADEGRIYGIWLDGELVGGVVFRTFEAAWGTCELGVWLAEHAQGQGLVSRAAQQLIDWAIGVRGLNRVEWRCVPANTRSSSVAKRLGMTHEGTLRQCFPHRGEIHDAEIWAMIRDEWEHRHWA